MFQPHGRPVLLPPTPPSPVSLVAGNPFAAGETLGMENGGNDEGPDEQRKPLFQGNNERLPFLGGNAPGIETNSVEDYGEYGDFKDEYPTFEESSPGSQNSPTSLGEEYSEVYDYPMPEHQEKEERRKPTTFAELNSFSLKKSSMPGAANQSHQLEIKDALVQDPYNLKGPSDQGEFQFNHNHDKHSQGLKDSESMPKFDTSVGPDFGPNFSSSDGKDFPTFSEEEKRFFEQAGDDPQNLSFDFEGSDYEEFDKFNFDYNEQQDFDKSKDEYMNYFSKPAGGGQKGQQEDNTVSGKDSKLEESTKSRREIMEESHWVPIIKKY